MGREREGAPVPANKNRYAWVLYDDEYELPGRRRILAQYVRRNHEFREEFGKTPPNPIHLPPRLDGVVP